MRAEFIYEKLDFQRGIDPKEAMGIGKAKELLIKKIQQNSIYKIDPKYNNQYFYYTNSRGKRKWENLERFSLEELKNLYNEIIFPQSPSRFSVHRKFPPIVW